MNHESNVANIRRVYATATVIVSQLIDTFVDDILQALLTPKHLLRIVFLKKLSDSCFHVVRCNSSEIHFVEMALNKWTRSLCSRSSVQSLIDSITAER